jgi:hypothetical protein
MSRNSIERWAGVATWFLLLAGCVSIERSYPDKRYFVLEVSRRVNPAAAVGSGVLEVSDILVSPRYSEKSFTYRTSTAGYETDFYNQFLVSPGALITEEVRKDLTRWHIFKHVIHSSSQHQPTHILDGVVNALYGDFRDLSTPQAVLEMQFFLSRATPGKSEILLEKGYLKSVPLKARTPEALVQGWNEALLAILTSLVSDLKTVSR